MSGKVFNNLPSKPFLIESNCILIRIRSNTTCFKIVYMKMLLNEKFLCFTTKISSTDLQITLLESTECLKFFYKTGSENFAKIMRK